MSYLYGYVTSRAFSNLYIPVPAQNSSLREYCSRNKSIYILPPLESYYNNCYHQLFGLINDVPLDSEIVIYSILMLPIFDQHKLNKIVSASSKKNIVFHFVLENLKSSLNSKSINTEILNYKLNSMKASNINVLKYF